MKEDCKSKILKIAKSCGKGRDKKSKSKSSRVIEYVFSIIINIVLFYVFNNLLNWNIKFLQESFSACLWILNISIVATIVANFLFIFFDEKWFKHSLQFVLNIIGFLFLVSLYIIFPFDFSYISSFNWNELARILLILGMIGTGISVFVEFFGLIFRLNYND